MLKWTEYECLDDAVIAYVDCDIFYTIHKELKIDEYVIYRDSHCYHRNIERGYLSSNGNIIEETNLFSIRKFNGSFRTKDDAKTICEKDSQKFRKRK